MSSSIGGNIQFRKIRSSVNNQNIDTVAPAKTDQLADAAHIIARDQLIPMAIRRQHNAIKPDKRKIYFYFKKNLGRTCSCVDGNNNPEGRCTICYKTGWVGGFDKYGTHLEILDTTNAEINAINIIRDFTKRPYTFKLLPDSNWGLVEWKIPVKTNIQKLDLLQVVDFQSSASIKYTIFNGVNWVELTEANITSVLNSNEIKVRAEFSRLNTQVVSPELHHIKIRYCHQTNTMVDSDWPHPKNSRALSEFGIYNSYQTLAFNVGNDISFITPEDWVYRSDRNERWKIIESDRYDPLLQNLGHEVTVRLIQQHEVYLLFPL